MELPGGSGKVPKRSEFVLFALVSLSFQLINQAAIFVDLPVALADIGIIVSSF